MRIPWILISLFLLYSCSDFHLSVVSNGSLPKESISDTVRIPADSIVVDALFSKNDTLFQADATIRDGWHINIPFELNESAKTMDTTWLYGTILARDTMNFALNHSGVSDPLLDVKIDTLGGLVEHQVKVLVQAGVSYQVRMQNRENDEVQFGALLLVGYAGKASMNLGVVDKVTDFLEMKVIAMDTAVTLPIGATWMRRFSLEENDSVQAVINGKGDCHALILNNQQVDEFLVDGVLPSKNLWRQDSIPVSLDWSIGSDENLSFLLINQDVQPITFADTLYIFRHHY